MGRARNENDFVQMDADHNQEESKNAGRMMYNNLRKLEKRFLNTNMLDTYHVDEKL